ncbi:MAG TPA: hypothetical protein PLX71_05310 [Phycicoccus sp.]|nr:hypothetical protein [Phycicoccus sp.]
MPTLYTRDISDETAAALKARAAEHGMSLSAYVGAELAKMAARPTNADIAARLRNRDRSTGPTIDDILEASTSPPATRSRWRGEGDGGSVRRRSPEGDGG